MEDLPPGFRFYPTEEELVSFYLHNKLQNSRQDLNRVMDRIIPVLDIYEHNPWQLPQHAGELSSRDPEQWFFFIPRQESEARGGRPNRLTPDGYWKATGSPGNVYSNNRIIGMKRSMVFYKGRAPHGHKTHWKMNEYKSILPGPSSSTSAPPPLRHEYSLCRVYKTSKRGRAFDRRPLGVERGEASAAIHGDEAAPPHQNLQLSAERATNSPENSSSLPIPSHSQSGEEAAAAAAPMSVDSEDVLWDWDQINFYYGRDLHN